MGKKITDEMITWGYLRWQEGYKQDEIAQALGINKITLCRKLKLLSGGQRPIRHKSDIKLPKLVYKSEIAAQEMLEYSDNSKEIKYTQHVQPDVIKIISPQHPPVAIVALDKAKKKVNKKKDEKYLRYEIQPRRGDIYMATLPYAGKSVQTSRRPVIIIQNNIGNLTSPNVIVVSGTSKNKGGMPTHVVMNAGEFNIERTTTFMCEQILTISKSCLEEYIGTIVNSTFEKELTQKIYLSISATPIRDLNAKIGYVANFNKVKDIHIVDDSCQGLVWVRCTGCGRFIGKFFKDKSKSIKCDHCETETVFSKMKDFDVTCDCGKHHQGKTNIDKFSFFKKCNEYKCGKVMNLQWNDDLEMYLKG